MAVSCRFILNRASNRSPVILNRTCYHSIEKEPLRTTVKFVTDTKGKEGRYIPPYVTRYTIQGFKVRDTKVYGSVAVLPKLFFHWKIENPEDITPESLALFTIMEPPLEILVVGTGERMLRLDPTVHKYMKEKRILLEVQDTPNAAATFNFLLEEERLVGAALIPPRTIPD